MAPMHLTIAKEVHLPATFLFDTHPSIHGLLNGVHAKIKSPCSFGYNMEEIKEPSQRTPT
jgi:hypothetical protein